MFPKQSILVGVAMFAAILLAPSVSADHDTPDNRCAGLTETDCSYCSKDGSFEDYSDSWCNGHYSGYSWQGCDRYVAGYCIQGGNYELPL